MGTEERRGVGGGPVCVGVEEGEEAQWTVRFNGEEMSV